MTHRRSIGVDPGAKRVGLAVSDPLGLFAQPVGAFSPEDALARIGELDQEDGIETLVVGWPLLPDGSEGSAAKSVRSYVARLRRRFPGAEIILWNEEYTSELARERIASGGNPSMKRSGRGRIDAGAAAILLQEYLNQQKQGV